MFLNYWHTYVQETGANEIERHLQRTVNMSLADHVLLRDKMR